MFGLMGTTLTLILMLITLALAIAWCGVTLLRNRYIEYRRNTARRKLQEKLIQRESNMQTFRAVAILPARPSCKLVKRYTGTRYLTSEAPHLPLAGCRVQPCRCRYAHYQDRRQEDRRNPFGIDHVPIGIDSNRRGRDRRRPHAPTLQYS